MFSPLRVRGKQLFGKEGEICTCSGVDTFSFYGDEKNPPRSYHLVPRAPLPRPNYEENERGRASSEELKRLAKGGEQSALHEKSEREGWTAALAENAGGVQERETVRSAQWQQHDHAWTTCNDESTMIRLLKLKAGQNDRTRPPKMSQLFNGVAKTYGAALLYA